MAVGCTAERRERAERCDHEAWIDAVSAEVGTDAREHFQSVIVRGETIVPRSDALGPCFERGPARLAGPEGGVDGYHWARQPGLPDAWCREW